MNSNRSSKLIPYLVLTLLTICLGSHRAFAQEAFQGTFTLPFETRWGLAVLPAGDYTLMLNFKAGIRFVDISRGRTGVATFLYRSHETFEQSDSNSALTLVRHGNGGTVLSLNVPALDEIYFFDLPKGERVFAQNSPKSERVLVAQAPALIQRIPVAVSGR
jgi:hypothetical protein